MPPGLFRGRAVMRSAELVAIDRLLRITAPHEWLIVVGLVIALAGGTLWSVFGRVDVTLATGGALVQPGARTPVVTTLSGLVQQLPARPGQQVAPGAPVAVVVPHDLEMRLRIARATQALLTEHVERSPDTAAGLHALARSQAETLELVALGSAGSRVASAHGGEVTRVRVSVGDSVRAGDVIADLRHPATGLVTAQTFLDAARAAPVRPGMAARVRTRGAEHTPQTLAGRVESVSEPGPPPAWLESDGGAAPPTGRLVRIAIEVPEHYAGADLLPCDIEIVLDRGSPLSFLFGAGRIRR